MISDPTLLARVPRRAFVLQLALALLAVVGANVAIARASQHSLPRQVRDRVAGADAVTDVFYGNSLIAAGVDERAFEQAFPGTVALNAGMGATGNVEHYLLELAFRGPALRRVYYGYLDAQLTAGPVPEISGLLGNRSLLFVASPDTAARYLEPDAPLLRLRFRALARVPMYVERGSIWARVERVRRQMGEYGRPAARTNQFGRTEDFKLLETAADSFRVELRESVRDGCPLAPAVESMLRHARARGVEVVLVRMPMLLAHRENYYRSEEWRAYEACVRARLTAAGATLHVDAEDWIADSEFSDPLHLSPEGAREFSTRLATYMRERAGS